MVVCRVVFHLIANGFIGLIEEGGQVRTPQVYMDRQMAFVHLTGDGAGTGCHLDIRYLAQRDFTPRIRSQHQVADSFRSIAALIVETSDDIIGFAADKYLRDCFSSDCQFDEVGNVRNVQSILGDAVTVCHNL